MELKDIDLNLLVVMQQMFKARSVSRAAEQLGLSQPALSNALARLRKLLGDPLFVRTAAGMLPTPLAQQFAAPLAQALATLHAALNQRAAFAPAHTERVFKIGMTDIGEIYFLPTLTDALARAAPGVALSKVRNTAVNLKEEMEAGHVDLAIGLLPQLNGGFFHRRLFMQRCVCLFRQGHALDKRRISLREFAAAQHLCGGGVARHRPRQGRRGAGTCRHSAHGAADGAALRRGGSHPAAHRHGGHRSGAPRSSIG